MEASPPPSWSWSCPPTDSPAHRIVLSSAGCGHPTEPDGHPGSDSHHQLREETWRLPKPWQVRRKAAAHHVLSESWSVDQLISWPLTSRSVDQLVSWLIDQLIGAIGSHFTLHKVTESHGTEPISQNALLRKPFFFLFRYSEISCICMNQNCCMCNICMAMAEQNNRASPFTANFINVSLLCSSL